MRTSTSSLVEAVDNVTVDRCNFCGTAQLLPGLVAQSLMRNFISVANLKPPGFGADGLVLMMQVVC